MKCPICGYEQAIYDDINEWWHCPQCHGSGEVQMTNEEYLKSCTTEQLATFLAIVQYDGTDLTLKKNHVEKWVAWLKQPHNS